MAVSDARAAEYVGVADEEDEDFLADLASARAQLDRHIRNFAEVPPDEVLDEALLEVLDQIHLRRNNPTGTYEGTSEAGPRPLPGSPLSPVKAMLRPWRGLGNPG